MPAPVVEGVNPINGRCSASGTPRRLQWLKVVRSRRIEGRCVVRVPVRAARVRH
jgi:hypothetical protein